MSTPTPGNPAQAIIGSLQVLNNAINAQFGRQSPQLYEMFKEMLNVIQIMLLATNPTTIGQGLSDATVKAILARANKLGLHLITVSGPTANTAAQH